MNSIKRLTFPDTLKGVAVILMIQVHLMEVFASYLVSESIPGQISLFMGGIPAAPVFMGLMGYFAALSGISTTQMMVRGIRLFVGGIVLNIALNFNLLIHVLFYSWDFNIWHSILGADILTLAGLSFILLGLINIFSKRKYQVYMFLSVLFATISYFFEPYQFENHSFRYLFSFIIGGTSWSYFPLVPWFSYPLAGFGLKLLNDKYNLFEKVNKKTTWLILLIFLLILIFTFNFGFKNSTILMNYYHHNLLFYAWTLIFIVLWSYTWFYFNNKFEENKVFRLLQFSGRNVTKMYVIQWLIIGNIGTEIYKSISLTAYAAWFFVVLLITVLLTYFINVVSGHLKNFISKKDLKLFQSKSEM